MLGIKKHVLKQGISMVASNKSFEPNQNKTLKSLKLANFDFLGPDMSHLNQTKPKPCNPKTLKP